MSNLSNSNKVKNRLKKIVLCIIGILIVLILFHLTANVLIPQIKVMHSGMF